VKAELLFLLNERNQAQSRIFRRAPGREYRIKILVECGYELFEI